MKISGSKIREIREKQNMSRPELSRRSGISIRTLEDWETGKRNPRNFDLIDTVAKVLKTDISSLYDEKYVSELNALALGAADRFSDSEQGESEMVSNIESIYNRYGEVGIMKLLDRFIYSTGVDEALKITNTFIDEEEKQHEKDM